MISGNQGWLYVLRSTEISFHDWQTDNNQHFWWPPHQAEISPRQTLLRPDFRERLFKMEHQTGGCSEESTVNSNRAAGVVSEKILVIYSCTPTTTHILTHTDKHTIIRKHINARMYNCTITKTVKTYSCTQTPTIIHIQYKHTSNLHLLSWLHLLINHLSRDILCQFPVRCCD